MIVLDVGDVANSFDSKNELNQAFFSKAYPLIGYDAVGVGEYEASAIYNIGDKYLYGKEVPMIDANLLYTKKNEPVTSIPYIIKILPSGLRVGIISVVGESAFSNPQLLKERNEKIIPAKEALKQEIPKLRSKSDIIILLSHTDTAAAKMNVADVPGIDIVLIGNPEVEEDTPPEKVGDTIFMRARSFGKSVAELDLDINADRKIASYNGVFTPMGKDIQDDPDIAKLVEKYDEDMRTQNVKSYAASGPTAFVNSGRCAQCHTVEYVSWNATKHAHTYDSLRNAGRARDPDCVGCHTTGYKLPGGFVSEQATPELKDVQCEMCHGTGVIHSRRPAKGYGLVSENTCRACHDKKNSPDFDYKTYLEKVSHKKPAALQPAGK